MAGLFCYMLCVDLFYVLAICSRVFYIFLLTILLYVSLIILLYSALSHRVCLVDAMASLPN